MMMVDWWPQFRLDLQARQVNQALEWRVDVHFSALENIVTFFPIIHRAADPKQTVLATLRRHTTAWSDTDLARVADAVLALLPDEEDMRK